MEKRPTRKSAIRAKCMECSAGSSYEVRKCTVEKCPLWPFRLGKDPYLNAENRKGNPEALRKWKEEKEKLSD